MHGVHLLENGLLCIGSLEHLIVQLADEELACGAALKLGGGGVAFDAVHGGKAQRSK